MDSGTENNRQGKAMNLRPYHNPENIDESLVPDGWRFRYADEVNLYLGSNCRLWEPYNNDWGGLNAGGTMPCWTYIVPVNS
jgi:hypothetical protein